ncbi:MAG: hypothetical protein FJ150_02570 [Euryarchaeota archaeon]|nr:hypothetical protein [Euryarchaeota archaeon]
MKNKHIVWLGIIAVVIVVVVGIGFSWFFSGKTSNYPGSSGPYKPTELIQPTDLEYVGAFRLPNDTGEMGWQYSGAEQGAMTYYPNGDPSGSSDGYPGSIYGTGNDQGKYITEISIPVPVNSQNKNLNELNTASTLQPFQNILGDQIAGFQLPKVALEYLPKQGDQTSDKLYYCVGQHLQDEERNPSHGWMELDLSNPQRAGLWKIDNQLNYVTTYYIFAINKKWADAYTPGMYLATGRLRQGGQGSQGPCIFAYGPWNEGNPPAPGTELRSIPLLLYSSVTDPENHTMKDYSNSDEWNGGAWLTSGDKSAVIFVGTKGVGNCWYGYSDGTVWPDNPPYPPEPVISPTFYGEELRGFWSDSSEAEILFYDPADLAAVAQGKMKPYEPQPYAKLNIDKYLYNIKSPKQLDRIGAVAYDGERGYLYVLEPLVDNNQPIIHAWRIKK